MIQQKFSLAVACPVLALIGLALGATNRKDGKLASFVLGIGVIFVYYILLYGAARSAMGGRISPTWAPWIANIVLGAVGVALMLWRARAADRPLRFSIPAFWQRARRLAASVGADATPPRIRSRARVVIVLRVPHLNIWRPRLLDLYVARQYLYVFVPRHRRAARHLLHRHVHRPRRQADSRHGDDADAAGVFLLPDAAVHLLHHPDVGARLRRSSRSAS